MKNAVNRLFLFGLCCFVCLGVLAGCRRHSPDVPVVTDAPISAYVSDEPSFTPDATDSLTEQPTEEVSVTPDASPVSTEEATFTNAPDATVAPTPTNNAETQKPTNVPTATPAVTPTPTPAPGPDGIPAIISVSGQYHTYTGTNVLRVDDRAYEIAYSVPDVAAQYAAVVNRAAAALSGHTRVYSLAIPTAYGIMMPDDMRPKIPHYIDMRLCIENYYSNLASNVTPVRCWDQLMRHRNENIYFRTDHHWTQRGAYYAYAQFIRAKGQTPYTLSSRRMTEFPGFLGSLYTDSGRDPALLPAETLEAFYPVSSSATMVVYDADGHGTTWPIISNVSNLPASGKYNAFAGSDNPLTVFTNPAVTDGSVLIITKDSFGNAMLPLLVDHFHKIYELDYRYWQGNIIDLANEVNATDLLFTNNFMMVNSRNTVAKLMMMLGN